MTPPALGEGRYACQATELLRAAPERISPWDARQYLEDVRSGNSGALATLRTVCVGLFNEYQGFSRRVLPRPLRIKDGRRYPFIEGNRKRTPFEALNLQPGELVRVKSKEEIVKTLDTHNANRGMSFDGEMVRYCGREARVLRRVEQIIDEKSGRMQHLKTPCVVLESVTCTGRYHRQCPRAIYPYWREIWLERVDEPSSPQLVLRRTPDVAAVKAARTGIHFGDTPTSRTSGRSNSSSTSRASARRPSRSRR